jgi:hypothetical protein
MSGFQLIIPTVDGSDVHENVVSDMDEFMEFSSLKPYEIGMKIGNSNLYDNLKNGKTVTTRKLVELYQFMNSYKRKDDA